jgi:hypothetical protein
MCNGPVPLTRVLAAEILVVVIEHGVAGLLSVGPEREHNKALLWGCPAVPFVPRAEGGSPCLPLG